MYQQQKETKNNSLKNGIFKYFILNGNATNLDLSKEFNLSIPTISKLINQMCEEGFVNEYGKMETAEGRKPTLYGVNPDSAYFVGVDILQGCLKMGLMNFRGDLVELVDHKPFEVSNTPELLNDICQTVLEFINHTEIDKTKILNININISGRVNSITGYSYSLFNFSEESLAEVLTKKLGYSVSIDNDTRAMTYGEYLKGCVNGEKDILFVNLSWGLGLGIIIDGQLYMGKSGFSGELGHTHAFENDIICHCGKKGCLETEVSGRAFYRIARERIENGEASILSRKGNIVLENLIKATNKEDPLCIDIIEEMGMKLGKSIASLINVFNPELVIIGGTLSLTGAFLIHAVQTSIIKYSLNLVNKDSKICISKLKERAGVIGACLLARKQFLETQYD